MRPSSAETSEPACVKRNILSIKSSTSCPSSSRKYSATVKPVRPTRRRAPGGSVICPYTRATFDLCQSFGSTIPASCISIRSENIPPPSNPSGPPADAHPAAPSSARTPGRPSICASPSDRLFPLPAFRSDLKIFRHRQTRQAHPQTRTRRLRHLPVHQGDLRFVPVLRIDYSRFLHFDPEIVAFARALANTRKYRHAAMLHGDIVDELLNNNRLADTCAAEQTDLSAAQIRLEQIDHFDTGLEHLEPRRLFFKCRRCAVNRRMVLRFDRPHVIDRLSQYVQHAPQRLLAHRNRDRRPQIVRFQAAHQSVRRLHCDRAHAALADVLRHFRRNIDLHRNVEAFAGHLDRVEQLRHVPFRKLDLDRRTRDLNDVPFHTLLRSRLDRLCCHNFSLTPAPPRRSQFR